MDFAPDLLSLEAIHRERVSETATATETQTEKERDARTTRAAAAISAAAAVSGTSVNFSLVLSVTDPDQLYQAVINLSSSAKARIHTFICTCARS